MPDSEATILRRELVDLTDKYMCAVDKISHLEAMFQNMINHAYGEITCV